MSKHEEWIDGLLKGDEIPQRVPTRWERELQQDRWPQKVVLYLAMLLGVGCLWFAQDSDWQDTGMIVGAVVCLGIFFLLLWSRMKVNQVWAEQREDELAFARQAYLARGDQRPGLVATLTAVEIEKYRAQGALNAAELAYLQQQGTIRLTYEEAARVREHETNLANLANTFQAQESARQRSHDSRERERDRQLTIDQLITKFDGQIREIETRMALEKPDAHYRSQQEAIRLRSRLTQLTEINKLRTKDPVLHKQLFDDWKRGYV